MVLYKKIHATKVSLEKITKIRDNPDNKKPAEELTYSGFF
jgi:hypothetical protein